MLSKPWNERQNAYDFVVIGSGYGGAITAARIAAADLPGVLAASRNHVNPLGLFENNHLGSAAYLKFDPKPDGRLESSFQLPGLMEGLIVPSFAQDHFRLADFTTFHNEIRKLGEDRVIGKYVTALPDGLSAGGESGGGR